MLKRGSRRLETTKEVYIGSGRPLADYQDEKMSMVTTVYKDKATRKLQDRVGNLIVQIKKKDGEQTKSVGMVKVNLVEFIDASDAPSKIGQRQTEPLLKCPDKNATV